MSDHPDRAVVVSGDQALAEFRSKRVKDANPSSSAASGSGADAPPAKPMPKPPFPKTPAPK